MLRRGEGGSAKEREGVLRRGSTKEREGVLRRGSTKEY